ncbi:hypothetical protein L6452_11905 [Arctium lappa]|uniref:Uncharacterized protein n=1 Tax=Arctium lappa TaxID=4217 RepID=A0ACB9DQ27_ARCLA|nr:hypothetical protein L6452_11905 [Arctium lappa]
MDDGSGGGHQAIIHDDSNAHTPNFRASAVYTKPSTEKIPQSEIMDTTVLETHLLLKAPSCEEEARQVQLLYGYIRTVCLLQRCGCHDHDAGNRGAEGRYRLLKTVGNKLRRFDVCWGLQSRCNRDCPGQGPDISMKIDCDCLLLANSAFVFVVYSALCSCFVFGF